MLAIVSPGVTAVGLSHARRSSILFANEDIYLKLCIDTALDVRQAPFVYRICYQIRRSQLPRRLDSSIKPVDS